MELAIMQPYFFPYAGYFQLVKAVDKFIFYDDVNFIKNGWINRNRILLGNHPAYFTVQLKGASPFKQIKDIEFTDNRSKLKKTIEYAYKRAPFYNIVAPLVFDCLDFKTDFISELAIYSVTQVSKFLSISTCFEKSSEKYGNTKPMERTERIKCVCNKNNAYRYINLIGGAGLYEKNDFAASGIELAFIRNKDIVYKQIAEDFVPSLSIIDVMMFNSTDDIRKMLDQYELA